MKRLDLGRNLSFFFPSIVLLYVSVFLDAFLWAAAEMCSDTRQVPFLSGKHAAVPFIQMLCVHNGACRIKLYT